MMMTKEELMAKSKEELVEMLSGMMSGKCDCGAAKCGSCKSGSCSGGAAKPASCKSGSCSGAPAAA